MFFFCIPFVCVCVCVCVLSARIKKKKKEKEIEPISVDVIVQDDIGISGISFLSLVHSEVQSKTTELLHLFNSLIMQYLNLPVIADCD